MGLFNRNKTKAAEPTADQYVNDKLSSYFTGGNMFEMDVELKAQHEKSKISLASGYNDNYSSVDAAINSTIEPFKYIDYYLLKQWGMYFTNLFRWESNSPKLDEKIKKLLYYGFFNGESALFYNPVSCEWDVVLIAEKEIGFYGNIRKVKYYYTPTFDKQQRPLPKNIFTSTDPSRFVFYTFRTDALSCWVWLWPAVRIQQMLLNQINVANIISNKQIMLSIDNETDNKKELETFLSPLRFWIFGRAKLKLEDSIKRLTDQEQLTISEKYLEIYRQTMDIYHDIFGYRNNSDFKKERNVSNEVDASQSMFDNIQNEYFFNFDLFIRNLQANSHFYGVIKNLKQKEVDDNETERSDNSNDL